METTSKELKGYIKTESMMLVVLLALAIGFLGGIAFSAWKTNGQKDLASWIKLGHLYFDADQPEQAIDAYQEALRLNPELPDIWTDIGVMYRRNDNPRQAIASFDRALSIDPDHETALFNKGVVLMHDLSNPDEALAVWTRLIQLNPQAEAPGGQRVQDLVNQLKKSQH